MNVFNHVTHSIKYIGLSTFYYYNTIGYDRRTINLISAVTYHWIETLTIAILSRANFLYTFFLCRSNDLYSSSIIVIDRHRI